MCLCAAKSTTHTYKLSNEVDMSMYICICIYVYVCTKNSPINVQQRYRTANACKPHTRHRCLGDCCCFCCCCCLCCPIIVNLLLRPFNFVAHSLYIRVYVCVCWFIFSNTDRLPFFQLSSKISAQHKNLAKNVWRLLFFRTQKLQNVVIF